MGVNVGMFVAGGLLQGVGQGIEKKAELERQNALLQYQANRELGLKMMELQAHHEDAALGATSRVEAAKESAKGQIGRGEAQGAATVKAAEVNAGASTSNNIRTTGVERDKIALTKTAQAYLGKVLTHDDDGNMIIVDKNGGTPSPVMYPDGTPVKADNSIKVDPNKPMSEINALAVAALSTDMTLSDRAKKNKITPVEQAVKDAQDVTMATRKAVGADKPKAPAKVPGLVSAPPPGSDDSAAAAAATAPQPPNLVPGGASPIPAQPAAPPLQASPPAAPAPLTQPIPLPADQTKWKDGQAYSTPKGNRIYKVDPQGKGTFIPMPTPAPGPLG